MLWLQELRFGGIKVEEVTTIFLKPTLIFILALKVPHSIQTTKLRKENLFAAAAAQHHISSLAL